MRRVPSSLSFTLTERLMERHSPDVLNESDPVELTLRGWRDLDCRKSMDDVYRARGRFESALRHDGDRSSP